MRYTFNILAFVGFSVFFTASFAQETPSYGTASLEAPACIALSIDEPLVTNYEMSIAALGFTDADELYKWTGHYSNNLITLSGDFDASKAYIQLHTEYLSEAKDVTWWNNYLSELCTYYLDN